MSLPDVHVTFEFYSFAGFKCFFKETKPDNVFIAFSREDGEYFAQKLRAQLLIDEKGRQLKYWKPVKIKKDESGQFSGSCFRLRNQIKFALLKSRDADHWLKPALQVLEVPPVHPRHIRHRLQQRLSAQVVCHLFKILRSQTEVQLFPQTPEVVRVICQRPEDQVNDRHAQRWMDVFVNQFQLFTCLARHDVRQVRC